jgi:hypothetical protein
MRLTYVTDEATERLLKYELGERAASWLHDVSPYEHNYLDDIQAMIPGNVLFR